MTVRVISAKKASSESTWHRDERDRTVTILKCKGWYFQRDDELPTQLNDRDVIEIKANEWHRVITDCLTNDSDLIILIKECKSD